MRRTRSTRAAGFTLMELLVVLAIAGLVSSILFEALSQTLRLQSRFGQQLESGQGTAMRADWFRQAIQGLQTDFADGKQVFRGRTDMLEGMSSLALSADPGAPAPFAIRLVSTGDMGRAVVYESGPGSTTLVNLGERSGRLVYVDSRGAEHGQWPPAESGKWEQLPAAVLLRFESASGQEVWVGVPRGTRDTKLRALQLRGPLS